MSCSIFSTFATKAAMRLKIFIMNYEEYLKCSRKHLKSCQQLLVGLNKIADNKDALLDLWYLSGYIMEGFTVYSVYKTYGWDPNIDIQRCHPDSYTQQCWDFLKWTNVDFYRCRKDKQGNKLFKDVNIKYSIEGHNFQDLIRELLNNVPIFNDFPILGFAMVDPDVRSLVDNWKPYIRYWYKEEQMRRKHIPTLTVDLLKRLIETCEDVYKKIILI